MKTFLKKVVAWIVAVFKKLADAITDEKNQLDERRILGIACYVVGLYLALAIPTLVMQTKDLASAGALAAVITVLFGAGAALLDIARRADAALLTSQPGALGIVATIKNELAEHAAPSPISEAPAKDGE